MTIPGHWTNEETDNWEDNEEGQAQIEKNFPVVPVKVIFDENQQLAASFCACMTWTVPVVNINTPLLIIPRKESRFKTQFIVNFPAAGILYLNTKSDPLTNPTPQGFNLIETVAGNYSLPPYEAMQPMYAIATIPGITISMWDQSFGTVSG